MSFDIRRNIKIKKFIHTRNPKIHISDYYQYRITFLNGFCSNNEKAARRILQPFL